MSRHEISAYLEEIKNEFERNHLANIEERHSGYNSSLPFTEDFPYLVVNTGHKEANYSLVKSLLKIINHESETYGLSATLLEEEINSDSSERKIKLTFNAHASDRESSIKEAKKLLQKIPHIIRNFQMKTR